MNIELRTYQILVILGTFAAAVLPAWVAVEIFRTQTPTKSLEVSTSFANPIDSLGSLKDKAKISMTVGEKTYENLTVASITISNRGTSPITDLDIKSPITATASNPWKIVAVGEFEVAGRAAQRAIVWENKDGTSIVASSPFLLNQGESYTFPIYLTRMAASEAQFQQLTLFWTARIVGLPEIKNTEYGNSGYSTYTPVGLMDQVVVYLSPRNVFSLFGIAFLLSWLYLHLLSGVTILKKNRTVKFASTIGLVFVAVTVGEVFQTYFSSNSAFQIYQPSWVAWTNGAIVLIGLLLALTLYFRGRIDKRESPGPDSEVKKSASDSI